MSSFNEIRAQIEKEITQPAAPTPIHVKPAGHNRIGTLVSNPGTEKVQLDASTFQLMTCTASGQEKPRFCIVEKNIFGRYGNHFINSQGFRTHIITKEVYTILIGVLNQASEQIRKLGRDLNFTEEQRDLYKMTIDALRRNGVIE